MITAISREHYDASDQVSYQSTAHAGLDESVIRLISQKNHDPDWMLELRLQAFSRLQTIAFPSWGPSLEKLDLNDIIFFWQAEGWSNAKNWDAVPEKIKNTFERLGIPEAERTILAGVWAQYDSEVVYHSLKQELQDKWVIFEDISVAIRNHESLVREYFARAVGMNDHYFATLHYAVWSGGTFLFIPQWVKLEEPLQAYFRMNMKSLGQFEHTIIVCEAQSEAHYIEGCSAPKYGNSSLHAGCVEVFVKPDAKMRYSSVENWSSDTFNLNTKRAIVAERGFMEWIWGNLGSGVTMLYPCSILKGDDSVAHHLSLAFAAEGQDTDTGAKVIHVGKRTRSEIISKSLSKSGISTTRILSHILPTAEDAVSHIQCDGLLLDEWAKSDTE